MTGKREAARRVTGRDKPGKAAKKQQLSARKGATSENHQAGNIKTLQQQADQDARVQAGQAVTDSEARANALIKFAPASIYEIDNRGPRFLSVNDAMCKTLGYTREELFSIGPMPLLDEKSQALFAGRMKKQLAGEQIDESVEYRVRKKDGGFVDVLLHVALNTSNNEPYRVLVVAEDVTQRNQAERAIRENEATLRGILDATQESIWMFSLEGNILMANKTALARLHKPAQEVIGQNLFTLMPWDIARERMACLQEVIRTGRPVELEDERAGMNFHHTFYPVHDAGNQVVRIVAFSRDITERKRVEAETARLLASIQQEKERLKILVDNISDEVWFADSSRKFTLVNPAALREFDILAEKEVDVEKFAASLEVFRPDGSPRPIDEAPPLRALRGEQVRNQQEIVRVPASGDLRHREVSATPVKDLNGNIIGAISIVRDITDRKKAEQALAHSNQKISEILSSIKDDFYVLNHDWKFVYANKQFTGKVGKEPEDFIGNSIWEMFPKHVGSVLYENFHASMEKGEIRRFEIGGQYTEAWYSMTSFPSAEGITVLGTDITERKQAEAELQGARELAEQHANELDAIFNGISEVVIVYDASGRVQRVNQATVELLGFNPSGEEIAGLVKAASIRTMDGNPLDPAQLPATLALKGKNVDRKRIIVRDAHGRDVFIVASAAPFRAGEQIFGAVAVWHDVTERERLLMQIKEQGQRAEALARQAEQHTAEIETVFNAMTDSILVYSPGEIATRVNAAAKDLLGYDPTGLNLVNNMVTSETREAVQASATYRALHGEPVKEAEFEYTSPTGERRTISASSTPMRDSLGHILGAVTVARDVTKRKQAEAARAWLASFPEKNPNPVVEVDQDGQVRYANPSAQRLFPDLQEQTTGHAWLADWDTIVDALVGNNSHPLSRDVTIGDHTYQQAIIHDPQNGYIRIYGLDITDRMRAEMAVQAARNELELRVKERTRQLSEANAELRLQISAMEAAANGIFITDNLGNIQWCNPAFAQMTGFSREEVIGRNPRFLKSGQYDRAFYEQMWQQLLGGHVWHSEMVNRRKDGMLYTEDLVITPVTNEQNQVTHFIAINQDISARKHAEDALARANAYNRSLLEASLDPLVTITPEGKVGDVNTATEKVTGRSRQELIGTDFHSYFSDPAKARAGYRKVFKTGSVHDYELGLRHKDGHITPVLYNAAIYRDSAGEVQGVFAAARDISARRQAEAELEKYHQHLEELVRQRTSQLEVANSQLQAEITERQQVEEQLRQARDELERRVQERTLELKESYQQLRLENEERQRMADNLHDAVNQSLFSAGLIAEVLPNLWERDQEGARQSLKDLRRLTRSAQGEMRALLAELRPSVVTDNGLDYFLEQLSNAFTGRTNLPVAISLKGEMILQTEAQVVFYRVVQEALNNIAKHARATRVEVVFQNEPDQATMRITDDGRGFDPRKVQGQHYGLRMMQERAKTIGAQLSIESQPGHGTRLCLSWKKKI